MEETLDTHQMIAYSRLYPYSVTRGICCQYSYSLLMRELGALRIPCSTLCLQYSLFKLVFIPESHANMSQCTVVSLGREMYIRRHRGYLPSPETSGNSGKVNVATDVNDVVIAQTFYFYLYSVPSDRQYILLASACSRSTYL